MELLSFNHGWAGPCRMALGVPHCLHPQCAWQQPSDVTTGRGLDVATSRFLQPLARGLCREPHPRWPVSSCFSFRPPHTTWVSARRVPLGRGLCGPLRPAWDCSGVHFGVTTCARLPRQFGVLPWCTCRVCLPDPAAAASQAGPRVTPGPQAPALGTGHLVASTPPTPSFANRSPSRWAPAAQGGRPARVFQGSASGSAELFWGTGTYYLPSSPSVRCGRVLGTGQAALASGGGGRGNE